MALTTQQIQSAYVTFFSRPADVGGLNYWADYEGSEADLYTTFAQSKEYADLFEGKSNSQKVAAVYQNLFGRAPEAEGLNYWTLQLDKGAVTVASLALAVAGGAQGTDAETLANRVSAATTFTQSLDTGAEILAYQGNDANAVAKQWLSGVTDQASLEAAVTEANLAAVVAQMGGDSSQSQQLTNGTDKLVGNKFEAAQVYTPGGNDRINSLQNDDELTGTGANPTLNVTLGNPGDNGNALITPTLKGIETINARFDSTDSNMTLDLQDSTGVKSINVTRIADGRNATVQNIADAVTELSVANSNAPEGNVNFTFLGSAVKGTADAVALKLSNVNVNSLRVEERGTAAEGFETINLTSTGAANAVKELQAEDLKTLNIAGDKALSLGSKDAVRNAAGTKEATSYKASFKNVEGSLSTIDASALTADLEINLGKEISAVADNTSGVPVQFTLKTGSGNDTIRLLDTTVGGAANNTDKIDGGEGKNTLVLQGSSVVAAATPNVTNIQNVELLLNSATARFDANAFDEKFESLYVRNEGNNGTTSVARAATTDLLNLKAAQAANINLGHGTTGNNSFAQNIINVDVADGVTTVGVKIEDKTNSDERFNFVLNADSDRVVNAAGNIVEQQTNGSVNTVANVTITDNDSESNTIALGQAARHFGTVKVEGSSKGFLNLDTTTTGGNGGLYGYNTDNTVSAVTGRVVDAVAISELSNTTNQVKFVGASFDSSTYEGNVVLRVDTARTATGETATGGQNLKFGKGNDTVIFDKVNDERAGLTISDTVAGGEGNDVLVIDGQGVAIQLGASEWTNVSGFETIRLVGNGVGANNAAGQLNSYNLTLTNELIAANGTNGVIAIVNDNDPANDVLGTADTAIVALQGGATIDARGLSSNYSFTYNGEEGTRRTADRFIFSDANLNGKAQIDGGAVLGAGNAASNLANTDILEVRNAAVVTAGDLAGIKNVGTLSFSNDTAAVITSVLQLNNDVVDALVNSTREANAANVETLTINALDNPVLAAATTQLNVDATAVTSTFLQLNVTGGGGNDTIAGGAGNDSINGGAGDDSINGGAGDDSINGGAGNDTITGGAGNDTITLGAGNDVLVFNSLIGADTIVDYSVADDSIQLSKAVFTALATSAGSALTAAEFLSVANAAALGGGSVAAATDAQQIIFLQDTGALYYNTDGVTAGGLTLIGTFSAVGGAVPALVLGEFSVIA